MRRSSTLCIALLIAAATAAAQQTPPPKPADSTASKDPAAEINTPRPDARRIDFDATEGTWMSVDASPDGATLIFDLLGDIYSVPVAGGTATALTSGPAFDAHPRFSPDGKTIAFTSDRSGMENVWLMDADGKNPRALTTEKDAYVRSAAWTPDGQYLIARKEDGKRAGIPPVELWIYHREGGGGIKLTSSDDLNNAGGAAVSKDGRWIYFSARERKFNYVPDLHDGLWQVWRYDRELAETSAVTSGFGGAVRPAVSPDGKTLTFLSRRDDETVLVARDLASGSERILAHGLSRDEMEGFAQSDLYPNYAFLPDGKAIVLWNRGHLLRVDVATGAARHIPFTAHVAQWLAPRVTWQEKMETGPVKARILRWPGQSPDGRRIAFEAFGRVWLQDVANGKASGAPRRLTRDDASLPHREYAPEFSPDGKWIAYVSWSDASGGHVWKAPAAPGSVPVRLTRSAGHYANPAWSPKGDRLALLRGSGLEFRGRQPEDEERFEIVTLDAAGGDPRLVTTVKLEQALKFHPEVFWNADGSRLFFRDPIEPKKPTDDPKSDLVSVRLDGTDRRKILRFPVVDDIVPSPDEQWVVFTSRDNVYVAALPRILTKEPPEVGLKEGAVPVYRLSDDAGGYVSWADGGKTITWAQANTYYRLPLTGAIDFAREQKRKAEEKAKQEQAKKGEPATEKEKEQKEKEAIEESRVPKAEEIAITLTAPRAAPEGSFVLRGARVVTMHGDGVIENADVVVTNNRIAAVGASGSVAVPAGAKVLDAKGETIIPGFVDTHAHLHYSGFELFPEAKWEYVANLAYGVTTVYDPSAPSLDVFAQGEEVEAGMMIGPRVYSSGDVLYGGQQSDAFAEVNNLDDAKHQVRRMKAYGARMIKVYQQPRRSQRIYFAEACRSEHMLLTAEGAGELETDETMATDGFTAWEHALPIALQNDVVEFFAKSGSYYTPTLLVAYGGPWGEQYYWQTANPHDDPKLNRFVPHDYIDARSRRHPWIWPSEYHFPTVAAGAARILRAGGNVSLGAHGQLQGLGPHWEIWAMAGEGGPKGGAMTPMEALRASTISAADKIGFSPDLGSIEAGKLADMIVLDANPLDDIHNTVKIRWVVKNGDVWDAATMRKVWPREEPAPQFFWKKGEETQKAGAGAP
ncbi:MAG TPA: amidohydrolase family protein [Thermoanaerobaculia bacterium]|nr:amidohydrolase family protein [Thermoanaerobaculia bacterium]